MTKHDNDGANEKRAASAAKRWSGVEDSARKSHAAKMAHARWSKDESRVHVAEHMGTLKLGGIELPCAVLDDGTRVLSERGLCDALLHQRTPADFAKLREAESVGEETLPILVTSAIRPFLDSKTIERLTSPIRYQRAKGFGIPAKGVPALCLPGICEAYLRARDANVLSATDLAKAQAADLLMRGFAMVGVNALIDEATGYQVVREKDELQQLLEKYISEEFRPWSKTFPVEYYIELFRLRGITTADVRKRPQYFGKLTNDIVYNRLIPGALHKLQDVNPSDEKGRRARKHHQHIGETPGGKHLSAHIASVVTLMRASLHFSEFLRLLDRAMPRQGEMTQTELPDME